VMVERNQLHFCLQNKMHIFLPSRTKNSLGLALLPRYNSENFPLVQLPFASLPHTRQLSKQNIRWRWS
jgi:hypothetical protein